MFQNRRVEYKRRTASGFTLIEMLVVITIILMLMAGLMGAYGMVMKSSKRAATQTLIDTLNSALNAYSVDFGCFPPNPSGSSADDGTLWQYLVGPNGRGIDANVGTKREKHYNPYISLEKRNVKNIGDKLVVVDSWGEPIHYFNAKEFVDGGGAATNVYHPDGVDLYSTGPDKKKDPDLVEPGSGAVKQRSEMKLVDDMTN